MATHPLLRTARDFLLLHRTDYSTAAAGFSWPDPDLFNFATDWFDGLAAERGDQTALQVIDAADDGTVAGERQLTFTELRNRSIAAAHWLS